LSSYGADGDPPTKHFEWRGLLNGLPDQPHLLLLRDLCQHWYLGGLLTAMSAAFMGAAPAKVNTRP
jgi:hypothetical protein